MTQNISELIIEQQKQEQERCFFISFEGKTFSNLTMNQQAYIYEHDKDFYNLILNNKSLTIATHKGSFMSEQEKETILNQEYYQNKQQQTLNQSKIEQEKAREERQKLKLEKQQLFEGSPSFEQKIDKMLDDSFKRLFEGK